MSFQVQELPRAQADVRSIFKWLHERSPQGARTWLTSYDKTLSELERLADSFSEAAESQDCDFEVRQVFFKTRRGRVYRALYFIEGDDVFILRVRGTGQAPVHPDELGRE